MIALADLAALAAASAFVGAVITFLDVPQLRRAVAGAGVPRDPIQRGTGMSREAVVRLATAVGAGACGLLLAGVPGAVLLLGAAIALPAIRARRKAARERIALEQQIADGATGIAAGLRAGMSLSTSLRIAAGECPHPLSTEISRVCGREDMGVPLGESLETWAGESGGPGVRLLVSALELHRKSGGDLPRLLDRLSATLRARQSAVRELNSLTAQARLSGVILGCLPIGFLLFLSVMSPADISGALRTPPGIGALATGALLQAGAFLWIRRLLRIEV